MENQLKKLEEFKAFSLAMYGRMLEFDSYEPATNDLLEFDKMFIDAGYLRVNVYEHDQFYTYRYRKGPLQVELTFEDGKMVSSDIAIDEMIIQTDSKGIEEITRVLSKYMDHS